MATINGNDIRKIVIACDAGMGSSVMLASHLRRELRKTPVVVEHTPVDRIPADADVIVVHEGLAERARVSAPDTVVVTVRLFLGDPAVNRLVQAVRQGGDLAG